MDHSGGRLGILRGPTAAHAWLRHLAPVRGALRLRRGALPARQHRVQRRSRGVGAAVSEVDSGRASPIRLTFACELGADRLSALFSDGSTIEHLQVLGARVALMLSDLSTERADVVRKLNEPGVRIYQQIAENPWRVVPILLRNLRDRQRPQRASAAYNQLVDRMRGDGW